MKMKPFQRATPVPMTDAQVAEYARTLGDELRSRLKEGETVEQAVRRLHDDAMRGVLWKNDEYQVLVTDTETFTAGWPAMVHLSIKRLDRKPIRDWRVMQTIKNMLVGPEHEAVEIYPAESRLVDGANQYHLWAFADPEARWPFGFCERHVDSRSVAGAVQRPFESSSL